MNKDHYTYKRDELQDGLLFIKKGLIPADKRKDRYTSKWANIIHKNNKFYYLDKEMAIFEDIPKLVSDTYKNPVVGCRGYEAIYYVLHQKYFGISRDSVKTILNKLTDYQLHKPIVRQKMYKPIVTKAPLKHWQIDLTTMDEYQEYNTIVVVIDIFSKFIYTKALKDKKSSSVVNFLKPIFANEKPTLMQSDNGVEFKSDVFQEILKTNNIKHVFSKAYNPTTQGAVERVNRTIKSMLHRYMTSNNSKDWVSILPSITKNYNNNLQKTIHQTPTQLKNGDNENVKSTRQDMLITSKQNLAKHNRVFEELKSGDIVRVNVKDHVRTNTFNKGYTQNWSNELYLVEAVKNGSMFESPTYKINGVYYTRNYLLKVPIIGSRIKIYWKGDKVWYSGVVIKKIGLKYLVKYDDGTSVVEEFNNEKWKII